MTILICLLEAFSTRGPGPNPLLVFFSHPVMGNDGDDARSRLGIAGASIKIAMCCWTGAERKKKSGCCDN